MSNRKSADISPLIATRNLPFSNRSRPPSKDRVDEFVKRMEEDDRPRPRGDAASKLAGEDLGPYSQDELAERIVLLETEIARVRRHSESARAHRAAADALFGAKD